MKVQFVKPHQDEKKIGGLEYSVLKPSDIVGMTEIRLETSNFYAQDGTIARQGLLDPRMGASKKECGTCGAKSIGDCPGHFGFYELDVPIYHLGFFGQVVMTLNCLCLYCGQVKLPLELKQYYASRMSNCIQRRTYRKRKEIFKEIVATCKKQKECPSCGRAVEGGYKKVQKVAGQIVHYHQGPHVYDQFFHKKVRRNFLKKNSELNLQSHQREQILIHPIHAYYLLSQVPKEDQMLFLINPLKNELTDLITTILPIPPTTIRPSVTLTTTLSNEDDMTIKLKQMIKHNLRLSDVGEGGGDFYKFLKESYLMQCHYFHYFNSEVTGLPHTEMKDKKSIRALYQRLKGKRGRIRGNLSGKRVDYTARTVISPDPNLPIDNVTIPEFMGKILTIPESVYSKNIHQMRKLVLNGPKVYPGAVYLIQDGSRKDLAYGNRRLAAKNLKIGDIVGRHIKTGDIVLFNRQPSLHRISIMAFKARVDKWKTLRFNECACTPFNADFDGDEMNIHVPQTLEARSEALVLMDITKNLLTLKSGECLVALLQDFLTTAWLITNKDVFYNRAEFTQFCAAFSDANEQIDIPPPAIMKPYELWTGKQVINALLRPNKKSRIVLNLEIKESNASKNASDCMDPQDGYVIIDRSELVCGNIGKKVLGSSKSGLFYSLNRDNSSRIAGEVMLRFSKLSSRWISHYGMTIGIGDVTPTQRLIQENKQQVKKGYAECEADQKAYDAGQLEKQSGMTLEQTLESLTKMKLSEIREHIGSNCQALLKKDNKVLTMFLCGAKGSNINLSQMVGCVGQQIVSGRRVPDGFTDRSLPHFVRGERHPKAKGFVKNSFYTGMNAIEFFFHTMGGREGLIDTAVKTADTGYLQRRLIKILEDLHIAYDLTVRSCDTKEIVQFLYGEDGMDPGVVEEQDTPIKLNIIYQNTKTIIKRGLPSLLPFMINKELLNILKKDEDKHKGFLSKVPQTFNKQKEILVKFFKDKADWICQQRKNMGLLPCDTEEQCQQVISGAVSENKVLSKIIDNTEGIPIQQLALFVKTWMSRFLKILTPPGTAVGAIASQSIGEPATQMTLKTFHFAGVASMNVTLGVPRIKEILDAKKTIKTPIIKIKLDERFNDVLARQVHIQVEQTLLGQILSKIQEVYSKGVCLLRLTLDRQAIYKLGLELSDDGEDLKKAILAQKKLGVHEEQMRYYKNEAVLEIRFGEDFKQKKATRNVLFEIQIIKNQLLNVHIKGLPEIKQVVITKAERDNKDEAELKNERVIYAEGYGLKQIFGIDGVDASKTKTNHIDETYRVLGIEAARKRIIQEIVYTMKSHGIILDIRHILLAAELMTFKGSVLGFTRFGAEKLKDSPLMLASFEKTMEILFDAAIQGKQDSINGVSQRIIMGQNIPIGTGMFDVMFDCKAEGRGVQVNHNKLLFK